LDAGVQLGISSFTYTWAIGVPGYEPARPLTAVDLLERAAELGVRVVQVADNLPLHRLSAEALGHVVGRAAELGIAVEIGTRGIGPRHLATYLDLAERVGSPILRVVVDTAEHQPSEDEIVETVREALPELEHRGLTLAVENHDRFAASELARMMEQIGSAHIGICFDTVNCFGASEGPQAALAVLLPWVVNLHVKDYAVRRVDHAMGFVIEGRPAGRGQLDISWLLERVRLQAPAANAILELWTPPEETVEATVEKERAWAEESVRYLRQLVRD
jgi:sugar phosphate isomerase/epimerase